MNIRIMLVIMAIGRIFWKNNIDHLIAVPLSEKTTNSLFALGGNLINKRRIDGVFLITYFSSCATIGITIFDY